jgi:hypothetical protein
MRGLPWAASAAVTGVAAALLATAAMFPRLAFASTFFMMGLAALGAAASLLLDDPAAEVVAAAPKSLRRRTASRARLLALPIAVGLGGVTVADMRQPLPWAGVTLEMVGCIAVGFAVAVFLRVRQPTPGELAATTVTLGLLVFALTNPLGRWVEVFTLSPDDQWVRTSGLWTGVLLVAATLIARSTRDPLDT